jgi:hypothetical protein
MPTMGSSSYEVGAREQTWRQRGSRGAASGDRVVLAGPEAG